MKAYGKKREETCNRKKKGTSRDCDCCKTSAERRGKANKRTKARKKSARREAKAVEEPANNRTAKIMEQFMRWPEEKAQEVERQPTCWCGDVGCEDHAGSMGHG